MKCSICCSFDVKFLRGTTDKVFPQVAFIYPLYTCVSCGLRFICPQPNNDQLSVHYPREYGVYATSQQKGRLKTAILKVVAENFFGYGEKKWFSFFLSFFLPSLAHLPQHKKNGRLLDVGCGTGSRMVVFRKLGWNVDGIEYDEMAASCTRSLGFNVITGSFEECKLSDIYDVIYLNHVFEHLRDPEQALRKCFAYLSLNGEIILVVPNGTGFASRIFGLHWYGLDIPRHLYTFTPRSLRILFKKTGFTITSMTSSNILGSFTSSLCRRFGKNESVCRSFLDRPIWILNLLFDRFFMNTLYGDWLTIRVRKQFDL